MVKFPFFVLGISCLLFSSCIDLSITVFVADEVTKSGQISLEYYVSPLVKGVHFYNNERDALPLPPSLADLRILVDSIDGLEIMENSTREMEGDKGSGYTVSLTFDGLAPLAALVESSGYGNVEWKFVNGQWIFTFFVNQPEEPVIDGVDIRSLKYLFSSSDPYRISWRIIAPGMIMNTRPGTIDPENPKSAIYSINVFDYLEAIAPIEWNTGW